MKKNFAQNEALAQNKIKKSKEIKTVKNRENKNIKSPLSLTKNKNGYNIPKNNNKKKDCGKIPEKGKEKISNNKFIENNNECNKTNNDSTIITSKKKPLFLVACLLGNNKNNGEKNNNIKTNNIFASSNKTKEYNKYINKIKKNLLPGKKSNKERKKNSQINKNDNKNNHNLNNIKIKKEVSSDNNNSKDKNIINNDKKEKLENAFAKKEEKIKNKIENNKLNEKNVNNINKDNNNLFINKDNNNLLINKERSNSIKYNNNIITKKDNNSSNDEIDIKKSYNNLRTKSNKFNKIKNLKIFVNTSNNLKDIEKPKFNKNMKKMKINKSAKTPKNIFKTKIINLANHKNDNNQLNKSDNIDNNILKKNNSGVISKKHYIKSNSLEKFLNTKDKKFYEAKKNIFNLTKNQKRNPSSNFLLVQNSINSNNYNNKKKVKRGIKENKSCDLFFKKENSVDNGKINIRIINNNDEKTIMINKSFKKNFFKNLKLRKFKKHKSQDLNSKNTLNSLVISQNDIKNFAKKKENKTPEKISQKIIKTFKKEANNNNNANNNNDSKKYTYNILPGNNGKLIEKCLLNRDNWEIAKEDKKNYCNFIWTPLSGQINYYIHSTVENAQFVNHFEYHSELTNKSKTFINLIRYCEFNEINLFSFYPMTIIIVLNSNSFNSQIESFKKLYNDIPDLIYDEDDKEKNKNLLNKNYIDYFNVNLSKKIGSIQKMKIPKTHYSGKNMWLLKRDNLNRGRKIKVFSNLEDIIKEINNLYEQKSPCNLIIQKYLEQPLLYNNRKFDIRIWVLFTFIRIDNKYEVYVFKEGHLKACCDEFNIDSDDLFIHLTNYSVQKHNKNFSKTEIGNEISFNDFQKELNENHAKKGKDNTSIDFRKDIFPEIIKIIALSANAVKGKINLSNRANCFEIFGYDFILDANYRPFLLEINTNPGYEESSPLIKMLVPRMIDDAMKLTIDKEFETRYKNTENIKENNEGNVKKSKYEVEGYSSEENMWLKLKTKL